VIVYTVARFDLLGHNIGQATAHAHLTCRIRYWQRPGKYGLDDFKAL